MRAERVAWTHYEICDQEEVWNNYRPIYLYVLRGTWIHDLVQHIMANGGTAFLVEKSNQENYEHPMKTGARMDEVVAISGLARITFESVVREEWVHPVYKLGHL